MTKKLQQKKEQNKTYQKYSVQNLFILIGTIRFFFANRTVVTLTESRGRIKEKKNQKKKKKKKKMEIRKKKRKKKRVFKTNIWEESVGTEI